MTDYGWVVALAHELSLLDEAELLWVLRQMSLPQLRALLESWPAWAHVGQMPPEGEWRVWLMLAGRGFGKTRAGAEWVSALARERPDAVFALVGVLFGVHMEAIVQATGTIQVRDLAEVRATLPGLVHFHKLESGDLLSPGQAFATVQANPSRGCTLL